MRRIAAPLLPSEFPSVGYVVAVVVTVTMLCLPVLLTPVSAVVDYANHLARILVLADYSVSEQLQANYVVRWLPSLYLGMDLVIPPMAHLMSVYAAGTVFLVATFLLLLGACAIYFVRFRQLSLWPPSASLVVYNLNFNLGFVNYLFGAGIRLIVVAVWIKSESWSGVARVIAFVVLCLLVYFSDFMAFVGYGVSCLRTGGMVDAKATKVTAVA